MFSGAHAPNSHFMDADFATVELMAARSVKLMPYHTLDDVARLRALGVEHFTVRLPDSVWPRLNGEYIPSFFDYANQALKSIAYFYHGAGITDMTIDCEPNISWRPHTGYGPWQYRAWLTDVLGYLRPRVPAAVRLGLPPMSFAERYEPLKWLGPLIDTATACDFVCVNAYWQSNRQGRENILAGPMTWRQFGGCVEWYHDWQPELPLQVVEWGNSIHEQPWFTREQVDAFRREQYPLYVEYLRGLGYVEAAHVYLVGGTPDWEGFRVTPAVARAMAGH